MASRTPTRSMAGSESDRKTAAFDVAVETHRHELLVHCYRMVGSLEEAEDMVQETFLRAWQSRDRYEGRASMRTWLYRIATNACLDVLRRRRPRLLPTEVAPPTTDLPPLPDSVWLQPFPDAVLDHHEQPDAKVVAKETIELTFLVALQHLPPRQRAVLILRDVVEWSAHETSEALGISTASANSALQRARNAMRTHLPPGARHEWSPSRDLEETEQDILQRFMAAVEDADVSAISDLLSEDAVGCMPPYPMLFLGRASIVEAVAGSFDPDTSDYIGRFRLVPTRANGRPAGAFYRQGPGESTYRAWSINVLHVRNSRIVQLTSFVNERLFAMFGLPPDLDGG